MIIAEIGQAHDGSLGIAHSYIDSLSDTGVDAIKFQTHIANAESSIFEPFRVDFSYEDKTRMEYWKRMEFTIEEWHGLKKHCNDLDLEFISSPFSCAAVDLLEKIGVKRYKIGSGEVSNFLLLEKIARTGKPILLSSGLSTFKDLDGTLDFLKGFKNHISILQCTTSYPTKPDEWGLNLISELKERYKVPIGFSDHSGNINACLAATAFGAEILEFHTVFDRRIFGPDSSASITIDEVKLLVTGVNEIKSSLNSDFKKTDTQKTLELKLIFEKSLSVNKDLLIGHQLCIEDLETKKPSNQGISASEFKYVIGKKLTKNKSQWDFLKADDIE